MAAPHTPPQNQPWASNSTIRSEATAQQQTGHFTPSTASSTTVPTMTDSLDYVRICDSCPAGDGWGPPVTTETTLDGVPYAPFSKGDKLGRMADWTTGGKDSERGGRMQYQRNYRGELLAETDSWHVLTLQINKSTVLPTPSLSAPLPPRTSPHSPS